MIWPTWTYEAVSLVVVLFVAAFLVALARTARWRASGGFDRLVILVGALGASTAIVYVGALARAALAVSSVFAIVRLKAYPPHCASSPIDNCYALELGMLMILIYVGSLVPLVGVAGAICAFVGGNRIIRGVGVLLALLAVLTTTYYLLKGTETIWLGPPAVNAETAIALQREAPMS